MSGALSLLHYFFLHSVSAFSVTVAYCAAGGLRADWREYLVVCVWTVRPWERADGNQARTYASRAIGRDSIRRQLSRATEGRGAASTPLSSSPACAHRPRAVSQHGSNASP